MITVTVAGGDGGLLTGLAAWAMEHEHDLRVTGASVASLLLPTAQRPDVLLLDVVHRTGADPIGDVRRLRADGYRPLAVTRGAGASFSAALLAMGVSVLVGGDQEPPGLATAIRAVASGSCPVGARHGGPALSQREESVLRAYASGLTLEAAARQVGISPSTAKTYLQRVKTKYRDAGRPAYTKLDLARRLTEDFSRV